MRSPLRSLFLAAASTCAALTVAAPTASAATGYQNPFAGDSVTVGRTDMGVDLCLAENDPIRAIGPGVVIGVMKNWYAHQPYLWYELTAGPDAGRYVYVAEQIHDLAAPGTALSAGQIIARFARSGSCLETGWSEADGNTVAAATTGYKEGQVTPAGASFARLLASLEAGSSFDVTPPPTHSSTPMARPSAGGAAPGGSVHHVRRRKRRGALPAPPRRTVIEGSGGSAVAGTGHPATPAPPAAGAASPSSSGGAGPVGTAGSGQSSAAAGDGGASVSWWN